MTKPTDNVTQVTNEQLGAAQPATVIPPSALATKPPDPPVINGNQTGATTDHNRAPQPGDRPLDREQLPGADEQLVLLKHEGNVDNAAVSIGGRTFTATVGVLAVPPALVAGANQLGYRTVITPTGQDQVLVTHAPEDTKDAAPVDGTKDA